MFDDGVVVGRVGHPDHDPVDVGRWLVEFGTYHRDRAMRLLSEFGCRRTQDRAGVAADADGSDAKHLGIAGCLHQHQSGRPTQYLGFHLDRLSAGLNRGLCFPQRCLGMLEVTVVVVRRFMCQLHDRDQAQRHSAAGGLVNTPEGGRDRGLRTVDTNDDRFHRCTPLRIFPSQRRVGIDPITQRWNTCPYRGDLRPGPARAGRAGKRRSAAQYRSA